MSRLKNDPGLWTRFVPVAFHVDYWDRLGWRDRFSASEFTQRQSRYAALWGSESVYTPAVVLNGREWRTWRGNIPVSPNEMTAGVLTATSSDGRTWSIAFEPKAGGAAEWDAHLALLASGLASKVSAGENSGRNLPHDFVVLSLQSAAMKSQAGRANARLTMTSAAEPGARKAVAIWVSQRDQLAPVQATGGWLP